MGLIVALDENGDLDLTGGGPRLVGGLEGGRSALIYRLGTQAGTSRSDPGEWKYDYSYGVLWRQAIFGSYFSPDEAQSELADVCSRTTNIGYTAPYQVSTFVDPGPRKLYVSILNVRGADNVASGETLNVPV